MNILEKIIHKNKEFFFLSRSDFIIVNINAMPSKKYIQVHSFNNLNLNINILINKIIIIKIKNNLKKKIANILLEKKWEKQ